MSTLPFIHKNTSGSARTFFRKGTALVAVLMLCSLLAAESWTGAVSDDGTRTLSRADGKTVTFLNTVAGTTDAVPDSSVSKLTACLDTVWAIPGLKGTRASAAFADNGSFRFVVYPDELTFGGKNILQNLPSGLAFRFDTALFYEVTVKVNDLIPKVQGAYIAPDAFLSQLSEAIRSPELFLSDSYVFERLERLEAAVMALSKKGVFTKAVLVDPEIVLVIKSIYNENPGMTQKEMAAELKQRGYAASSADIAAVYMVYLGLIE